MPGGNRAGTELRSLKKQARLPLENQTRQSYHHQLTRDYDMLLRNNTS